MWWRGGSRIQTHSSLACAVNRVLRELSFRRRSKWTNSRCRRPVSVSEGYACGVGSGVVVERAVVMEVTVLLASRRDGLRPRRDHTETSIPLDPSPGSRGDG